MKKLIINADDFGLTRSISEKIIDTFKVGNLSSTSLIVNTPGSEYAIDLAKNHPELGLGLHFNLTEGKALSGVSSITDINGYFFNKLRLNLLMIFRLLDLKDIKNELNMQFEYITNAGLYPSHIDSHQHIHMNPGIFKIVADFAKEKNVSIRIAFPQVIKRFKGNINYKKRLKQLILEYASYKNEIYAKKISIKFNESFNSIFDYHPFRIPEKEDYINLVKKSLSDKHELMIHLYQESEELKEFYGKKFDKKRSFFKKANAELEILLKESIFSPYKLITFKDL